MELFHAQHQSFAASQKSKDFQEAKATLVNIFVFITNKLHFVIFSFITKIYAIVVNFIQVSYRLRI